MIHRIEDESYRILANKADLSRFGELSRHIVARVLHATADPQLALSMVLDDQAVACGIEALRSGAPIICDVEMVRVGLVVPGTHCFLDQARAEPPSEEAATLSAEAMRLAAKRYRHGAVVVIGCAPTALVEAVRLHSEDGFRPALIIGVPVGYVGAADAKEILRSSGIPSVSNVGDRGGSATAAAAFNAIARMAGS